jgi:type II secretion system protein N
VRAFLFVAAFVIAVLLMAPLERWVLEAAREPFAKAGADLRLGSVRLALPLGVRANDVGIEAPAAGLAIDSLYVGITRSFDADACGGRIRGRAARDSLSLDLSGVDPSQCLRVGKLALESSIDGKIEVDGLDLLDPRLGPGVKARIDVTSSQGFFGGILEHAARDGSDVPLGEWEFSGLVLHAELEDGEIEVEEGRANTSGVEWELLGGKLPSADQRGGLSIDIRARQAEDTPRSRAVMGLMPKGTPDAGGWRNFRVTGSLAAPRVVAVD